jgi:hypothetical protein
MESILEPPTNKKPIECKTYKKKIPIGQALGGHKKSCNHINNNFSIASKKMN